MGLSEMGHELLVADEQAAVSGDHSGVEGEEHAKRGEAEDPVAVDVEAGGNFAVSRRVGAKDDL